MMQLELPEIQWMSSLKLVDLLGVLSTLQEFESELIKIAAPIITPHLEQHLLSKERKWLLSSLMHRFH